MWTAASTPWEHRCAPTELLAAIIARVLLAIDVGNTQTHLGMFRGDHLVEHWRFATVRFATADELATRLASLLDLRDLRLRDVDAAIVSSVVPTLAHEYEQLMARYLDGNGALVGPSLKTGMPIRIDTPQELGADRLVNAVAAFDRVGGACIAVDFGTAINYDVVSSRGEYLGGVISPGIEISLEALAARAARLPRVDIEKPRHAIGKGTQEAIQAGVVYGFAGQVDGILGRLREELGEEATAIATGGFAGAIVPFCEQVDEVDDLLTLTGLKLIWERNRS
jgi:type III pantothenate kinase